MHKPQLLQEEGQLILRIQSCSPVSKILKDRTYGFLKKCQHVYIMVKKVT